MTTNLVPRLVALLIVGSLLVSCSSGDEPGGEPSITAEAWQVMLDQASRDQIRFSVAQDLLAGQCMREQGFDYESTYDNELVFDETPSRGFAADRRAAFDNWEPERTGYRSDLSLEGVDGEPEDPDGGGGATEAYDDAWYDAMFGPTTGGELYQADFGVAGVSANKEGCLGEATTLLGGQKAFELSGIATAMSMVRSEIDDRVVSDDRFVDAVERWATCMADQGFRAQDQKPYASPEQAREENTVAAEPDDRERRVATIDRDCQRSSGYIDELIEVATTHEQAVLSTPEAESLVVSWREIGDDPRRRIEEVLADNLIGS